MAFILFDNPEKAMDFNFAEFIKDWGYLAVFLGSMIEGESILLTASALAACGYMSIFKIFVIAFATTIITDQLLFLVGHKIGSDWFVKRFPGTEKLRDRAFSLLHKMDVMFIFSFRFIYGIRIISPIIIGSAKVQHKRFAIYNAMSGVIWAAVSCFVGYTIADIIMDGEFDAMPAVLAITISIIVMSGLMWLFFVIRERKFGSK